MTWLIEIIKGVTPGLIVAIVMAVFNRDRKKRDDAIEKAEERKEKAEMVRVSLLFATAKLTYALAMAAKRGTVNGEVEEGLSHYRKAMEDYDLFNQTNLIKGEK